MGHDSTLYTLFWRRLCSCLIWSTVFKSFQFTVLPEDFSKNECVQNCHRVMAWPAWKRAICTTPIPPARDGLPAAHWKQLLEKRAKKYQSTTHPTWMQPISEATIERTFQAGWCFLHAGHANLEVQACPGHKKNLEIYMTQSYRSNMWSSSKYMNLNRHGYMIEWFCSSIRI